MLGPDAAWIAGLLAAAVGITIGITIGRRTSTNAERVRELEDQLQAAEDEMSRYRSQVSQHFADTSKLLHDLTLQYRSVYEHLAEGARTLCPGTQQLLPPSLAEAARPQPVELGSGLPAAAAATVAVAAAPAFAGTGDGALPSTDASAGTGADEPEAADSALVENQLDLELDLASDATGEERLETDEAPPGLDRDRERSAAV